MLERIQFAWCFDPEAQEFHGVAPPKVRKDPGKYYVIRDGYGDLWVHDPWGRECHANFDFVEVHGMKFARGQFDPEKMDELRTSKEPPIRSLFTLSPKEIDDLRAEMRRDGAYMRECLQKLGKLRLIKDGQSS
ncbi:hypothetical protein [Pseudomonas sp. MH9.3]|uniref:hypothetical protein n=1 Tax=Pseudomonas sp. MH9.3 TaxID=3048630 RepID=UPI002AC9F0F4|nr:hypothetical protein [Pseudomonas sp. MH9.3]MEB0106045.1 hypothetical protein [Pseudomonas sp. MH9.3]WPX78017.1 hypothetical protein RHM60_17410 [Pseudomonas sp. MH9.3]WQG59334.1 hypothetical protein RHM66_09110 [Pseudomonas sp. RTB3]